MDYRPIRNSDMIPLEKRERRKSKERDRKNR